MSLKWQERLHWINKCNSLLALQWPWMTSVHKLQPFINWTSLQKWGKVIYVGNLIYRLPMYTHSCKVNKYEPFKTHQEKFLETFQMKIYQNTHGKRGCRASIKAPLLLDLEWLSTETVKCTRLGLLLQDCGHGLGHALYFLLCSNHSIHDGPGSMAQLIFIRVRGTSGQQQYIQLACTATNLAPC